jgi:peptide deformylase
MPILRYPDPRLHKVAAKVDRVDDKIRKLINDMAQTMYAAPGVGLAATQVDVHKRIIVIDTSATHDALHVLRQSRNSGSEWRRPTARRLPVVARY